MKKTPEKISFKKIKGAIDRNEMKSIMAGSGNGYWASICNGENTEWYLCNDSTGVCRYWYSQSGCYA